MILEYRVKENKVQAAWLKTLYDMVEELNCKCQTYLEEDYDYSYKTFRNYLDMVFMYATRIVEVYGSDTMLNWLKLRMERYSHFVMSFNEKPEINTNLKP